VELVELMEPQLEQEEQVQEPMEEMVVQQEITAQQVQQV